MALLCSIVFAGATASVRGRKTFSNTLLPLPPPLRSLAQLALARIRYSLFLSGLQMPFWGPIPDWIAYACGGLWALSTALFAFIVVDKFFREGLVLPPPVILLLISIGAFILATGPMMYAVCVVRATIFTAASISWSRASIILEKSGSRTQPSPLSSLAGKAVKYWAVLAIIGNFIYAGAPTFLSELGVNYTVGLAVIFAIVNFHHFLTDAAIWKLRDPKTREVLLNG
jgi:hypothetical protein